MKWWVASLKPSRSMEGRDSCHGEHLRVPQQVNPALVSEQFPGRRLTENFLQTSLPEIL